ncbi:MAG TPA: alpha/beta hydrolase [Stackebrandtia sp.]|jgi:pimeloyl-ACP methyl ester carboxylesterase|uniref:alpha/beta hydrolase n=1 Tax=Stackebrandtia sp. TaxID=2023065 RepID=UPI002D38CB21|nr:alpha/beta hydrolase [Stackebrandtia sp.]HZE39620.1 alpha/beta hydrolase [Stackebrandtia sp.]
MNFRRRYLPAIAAGALALGAITVVTATAQADTSSIKWKPCGDVKNVQCAKITVPVDWSKPDGEKIKIGIAKRDATDPDHRIGSIVADPGGPGGSGVDMVKGESPFTDKVNKRFDIIGFDPRGVNTSTQVKCDEKLSNKAAALLHPTDQKSFDALKAANRAVYKDCGKRSGAINDHADNLQTVEDIEAVRKALGEKKLNWLGYSYGTLMGQQYAAAYPKHIRAMVLDGNMDHSIDNAWDFLKTEAAPVEKTFVEMSDWCAKESKCALHDQDVKKVYASLKDKARKGTLTDPESGDKIGFHDLAGVTFGGVIDPSGWSDLAKTYQSLDAGKGKVNRSLGDRADKVINNVFQSAFCGDWKLPVKDYKAYKSLESRVAKENPNIEWSPYDDTAAQCVGYAVKTHNPQGPLEVKGAPPLVMIGNIHDPATAYPWSVNAAKQTGSHLITYEGYDHTVYGNGRPSTCVNDAVDAYLIDLKVPAEGLTCKNTQFPTSASGKADHAGPDSGGPFMAG